MRPLGFVRRLEIVAGLVAALAAGVVACSSPAPAPAAPVPGSAPPAAGPGTAVPAPRAYRNAQWGYSFDPPPGWVSVPDKGPETPGSERFVGPPRSVNRELESNPDLRIDTFTADGLDFKGMVEHAKANYLKGYRLLIDEDLTLADGRPAHLLGSVKQVLGYDMRELRLIVVDRGRVYMLATTSPEFTFGRDEPVLRSSLSSFTLG